MLSVDSSFWLAIMISGLILGLRLSNERQRYFVTMSLIGWAQTYEGVDLCGEMTLTFHINGFN